MFEISSLRGSASSLLGLLVLGVVFSCGGGGRTATTPPPPPPPPPPPGNAVTIEVGDNTFSPKSVTIQPGETVRWVFTGSASGHTVTHEGGAFSSGFVFLRTGDIYERTFGQEVANTTFNYRCVSHQVCCLMQGSVRVGDGAPDPMPGY